MTNPYATYLQNLAKRAGETLGVSEWFTINKSEAEAFKIVVGAPIRFKTPHTGTPLHPFHPVALITRFSAEIGMPIESNEHLITINYGFDGVDWRRLLRVGERARARLVLVDVIQKKRGNYLVRRRNTIEVDGETEPVLTAISCSYWFLRQSESERTAVAAGS